MSDKPPTKAERARAASIDELNQIEPPKDDKAEPKRRQVAVDFANFLDSDEAETTGVDAEVVVPNFVMDNNGHLGLAKDQSSALVLRLTPRLEATAMGTIASFRFGVDERAYPAVFEALLHPNDVNAWRRRIADATNPIPSRWLVSALSGMLKEHGIGDEGTPGKRD